MRAQKLLTAENAKVSQRTLRRACVFLRELGAIFVHSAVKSFA